MRKADIGKDTAVDCSMVGLGLMSAEKHSWVEERFRTRTRREQEPH